MKKNNLLAILMATAISLTSCDNSENTWDGSSSLVNIVAQLKNDNIQLGKLEDVNIIFTDVRTQTTTTGKFDAKGKSTTLLNVGTYNISIESEVDQIEPIAVKYCAEVENYVVKEETQQLPVEIKSFPAESNNDGFIVSEYFFNGETNSGQMMHPDQYIVIHNSSLVDLYADGLSIATTHQLSVSEKAPFFDKYMPDQVPVRGFFTIPGNGKETLVKAGESIVFAMTAIDHSKVEGYNNAVDLSGADFEYYDLDPEKKDVDNPAVKNVILTEGYALHPRGFASLCMFKLKDGTQETITEFYNSNSEKFVAEDGSETILVLVKKDDILDGIVTGDREMVTRPLPQEVDRGYFRVSGCHRQELAIRKTIDVEGEAFFMDTNDSEKDFILKQGQTAFPVGWRK